MPALPATVAGLGPLVVLLHGVGLGPGSFARLAERLSSDRRVVTVTRPLGAVPLDEQVDAVAATIEPYEASDDRAMIVGVSGGATLALALALRHPSPGRSFVLHEPLVGRLAAQLHDRFTRSARLAERSDADALAVMKDVLGPITWACLDDDAKEAVVAAAPSARGEVPVFVAFDPSRDELATLDGTPVLTTVGSRSGRDRIAAAEVLATVGGAVVSVVRDCGNAAQIDAPDAFADLIAAWRPASAGCR
ncbi:MAG: alpha/beta hydrolase [Acidimicrobiales bacterium]